MIRVVGPRSSLDTSDGVVVNTTSRSKTWSRELSPFFLGPVDLYGGYISQNVENAWQYSKVYSKHLTINGDPSDAWWDWARKGWAKKKADRYPMGKGFVPEYSYWDGQKLGYIEARKKIYIPLYSRALKESLAYKKLCLFYRELSKPLYLWDFDGYDHAGEGMSFDDVLLDEKRSMGHAFVIAKMLEMGNAV